jgi:hypothetical protein
VQAGLSGWPLIAKEDAVANPHDFTAREAERLRAAHAEELAQAQERIGLASDSVVQEFDGVWDPQTGLRLDISEEEAKG